MEVPLVMILLEIEKKSLAGNFSIKIGVKKKGKGRNINITTGGSYGLNEAVAEMQKSQHTMPIKLDQLATKYLRYPVLV
jgi:23S rRNA pseudoU1915 N3-methylase RlmH